ncbi:MAG TPA: hypothetical protein VGD71_35780 [Kribbella sp.]
MFVTILILATGFASWRTTLGAKATRRSRQAPGTPVVIPPSTTADGRLRWDGSKFPLHPLPSADAVLSEVLVAEQEYVELHGQLG